MKYKKINIKIQLIELNKFSIDFLKYNYDLLKTNLNVELNLFFWYNKQNNNISNELKEYIINLFNIEKIYDNQFFFGKKFIFDISYSNKNQQFTDDLLNIERRAKFYIFYHNEDSFINSIIELVSFIKAAQNKKIK